MSRPVRVIRCRYCQRLSRVPKGQQDCGRPECRDARLEEARRAKASTALDRGIRLAQIIVPPSPDADDSNPNPEDRS